MHISPALRGLLFIGLMSGFFLFGGSPVPPSTRRLTEVSTLTPPPIIPRAEPLPIPDPPEPAVLIEPAVPPALEPELAPVRVVHGSRLGVHAEVSSAPPTLEPEPARSSPPWRRP